MAQQRRTMARVAALGRSVLMTTILLLIAALLVTGVLLLVREIRSRNMQIWLGSYLRRRRPLPVAGPVHVMFCFVDHFEPAWGKADLPRSGHASIAGAVTTAHWLRPIATRMVVHPSTPFSIRRRNTWRSTWRRSPHCVPRATARSRSTCTTTTTRRKTSN